MRVYTTGDSVPKEYYVSFGCDVNIYIICYACEQLSVRGPFYFKNNEIASSHNCSC